MKLKNVLIPSLIFSFIVLCAASTQGDRIYLPLIYSAPPSTPPTLYSVFTTPDSAPYGSIVNLIFTFQFSDPNGDLDGGSLNFIDPGGETNSIPIPVIYQGLTSGTGYGYLNDLEIDLPPGTYNIPVYLKDKAGNRSNTLFVVWTVT